MKNIVIIGGSPAGVKVAEEIRALDAASSIRILLGENHLPFLRNQLAAVIANEIPIEKIHVRDRNFYEENRIGLDFVKKISRINFRKGQITFEDKEKFDYDILILTDTQQTKLPDMKGAHRSGIFGLRRANDAVEIGKLLAVAETVVIQSQTPAGLRLAAALRRREKDVIWVTPEPRVLSNFLNEEAAEFLRQRLEESGVRFMAHNEIAEVLGDTELKAVRLKSGKVIAVQAVLWPDAKADFRLFKESDLQFDEKIPVNQSFQTNISNVFVVDDMCRAEGCGWGGWEDAYSQVLEQQAKAVAASINGQGMAAEYPLAITSVTIQHQLVQFIGQTKPPEQVQVAAAAEPDSKKFRQILIEKDMAVGAVLVNCGLEAERFSGLIRERRLISKETAPLPGNLQLGETAVSETPVIIASPAGISTAAT